MSAGVTVLLVVGLVLFVGGLIGMTVAALSRLRDVSAAERNND